MKKLFFLMALCCVTAVFGRTRVVTNEEEFFAALAQKVDQRVQEIMKEYQLRY